MKDIRIDANGSPRCWNCGSSAFSQQRTLRSKVMFGVGAVLTKKKMKCARCGEYNDTGSGKPYDGPAARKYRKEWEAEQKKAAKQNGGPVISASIADQIGQLHGLLEAGALSEEEFAVAKAQLLGGSPLPPPLPPT